MSKILTEHERSEEQSRGIVRQLHSRRKGFKKSDFTSYFVADSIYPKHGFKSKRHPYYVIIPL